MGPLQARARRGFERQTAVQHLPLASRGREPLPERSIPAVATSQIPWGRRPGLAQRVLARPWPPASATLAAANGPQAHCAPGAGGLARGPLRQDAGSGLARLLLLPPEASVRGPVPLPPAAPAELQASLEARQSRARELFVQWPAAGWVGQCKRTGADAARHPAASTAKHETPARRP